MLKYAVLSTISMMKERNYDLYLEIKQECTDKHKKLNFDSLIDIMYHYRGDLSHAIKRAVYEENQESVKPITIFISSVCFSVCGNMKVYCRKFVSDETRKHRVNEHIKRLELLLGLKQSQSIQVWYKELVGTVLNCGSFCRKNINYLRQYYDLYQTRVGIWHFQMDLEQSSLPRFCVNKRFQLGEFNEFHRRQ